MSHMDLEERRRQIRLVLLAILCVLLAVLCVTLLARNTAFAETLGQFVEANQSTPGQVLLGLGAIISVVLLIAGYFLLPDKGRRK